jgi:hypothetical protein
MLGHLLLTASKIAEKEKLEEGFRIVINDGKQGGRDLFNSRNEISPNSTIGVSITHSFIRRKTNELAPGLKLPFNYVHC